MTLNADLDGWKYTSNGWETEYEGELKVSFVMRRFSGQDPTRLISTATSEQATLTVHPSGEYTPLEYPSNADELYERINAQDIDMAEFKIVLQNELNEKTTITAEVDEVITVEPNTPAEVIITKTENETGNKVFHFGFIIPRGRTGTVSSAGMNKIAVTADDWQESGEGAEAPFFVRIVSSDNNPVGADLMHVLGQTDGVTVSQLADEGDGLRSGSSSTWTVDADGTVTVYGNAPYNGTILLSAGSAEGIDVQARERLSVAEGKIEALDGGLDELSGDVYKKDETYEIQVELNINYEQFLNALDAVIAV
jgi:hypothetical protein